MWPCTVNRAGAARDLYTLGPLPKVVLADNSCGAALLLFEGFLELLRNPPLARAAAACDPDHKAPRPERRAVVGQRLEGGASCRGARGRVEPLVANVLAHRGANHALEIVRVGPGPGGQQLTDLGARDTVKEVCRRVSPEHTLLRPVTRAHIVVTWYNYDALGTGGQKHRQNTRTHAGTHTHIHTNTQRCKCTKAQTCHPLTLTLTLALALTNTAKCRAAQSQSNAAWTWIRH